MNTRTLIFITLLLSTFAAASSAPQNIKNNTAWSIERFELESTALVENKVELRTQRNIMVWLPPSYKGGDKRYPVIHYLHNANWSNQQMAEVERIHETFERALQRGVIKEFIFVVGDYTTTHGAGTFFGNNAVVGRWEDHIVDELVPAIDKRYRTIAVKDSRAISGDFFGGYGALRIAMHHPQVFSSVYAMHPVGTGTGDQLVNRLPNWELLNKVKSYTDLADASGYEEVFLMMAQSFLPNQSKPPFYADWMVELQGDKLVPNPLNIEKLRQNFTFSRYMMGHVEKLKQLEAIGFDWGRLDQNTAHITGNRKLSKALNDLEIPHLAEEYNGDQWSDKWIPFGRVENDMLPFFQRHLQFE